MSTYTLDMSQPVELGHPLNFGKLTWHFPVHGGGGAVLYNLMRPNETDLAAGLHGVLTNSPRWCYDSAGTKSGPGFPALRMASASSQYVNCGRFANIGNIANKTVIVKCNPLTLTGRPMTLAEDDTGTDKPAVTFQFASGSSSSISVGGSPSYNGGLTFTATAGLDYHLVAAVRGKNNRAYVNGQYLGSATSTTTIADTQTFYIGRYNGNYGQYFNGSMYSVMVYNRALNLDEIERDYDLSCRGYLGADSPLCWISSRTYFLPTSPPAASIGVIGGGVGAAGCVIGA